MNKIAHLKFNDPAPDAELLDVRGQPVRLSSLWAAQPLLLSFTRHFGCPQCKEMLDALVQHAPRLADTGLALAVVTQATPAQAAPFCTQRAAGVPCLADPQRNAYRLYGLGRGSLVQTLLSPRVWKSNWLLRRQKGFASEMPPAGQDAFQMAGMFIIGQDGRIRLPYYYDDIADHPPVELLVHGVLGMSWAAPFGGPIGGDTGEESSHAANV
jgi:peroxiredoxin